MRQFGISACLFALGVITARLAIPDGMQPVALEVLSVLLAGATLAWTALQIREDKKRRARRIEELLWLRQRFGIHRDEFTKYIDSTAVHTLGVNLTDADFQKYIHDQNTASMILDGPASSHSPKFPGWKRLWELLPFLFSQELRERVYDPAHGELLEDHLAARKYRTGIARAWLNFCFAVRTIVLFFGCIHVALGAKAIKLLLALLPGFLRSKFIPPT